MTETGRNLLHPDTLAALQEAVDAIEAEARDAALDDGAPDRRWLPAALNVFAAVEEVRR